jgi:hypothetical protein
MQPNVKPKNLAIIDSSGQKQDFRHSKAAFRAAETASQNFETPLLFCHIRRPLEIRRLRNAQISGKKS